MTTKLKLAGVGHDYGKVSAVRDFSLEIEQGEFISLLGPSGCGKTTMLRMIAGFIVPTRGTIEMNGRVISSPAHSLPPEKRGMSMIFQSYAIYVVDIGGGVMLSAISGEKTPLQRRQLVRLIIDPVDMAVVTDA